jgi:hypothetical protein
MPVVGPTVATLKVLLVHIPPLLALESVVEVPIQILNEPVIADGGLLTVTVCVT